MGDFLNEAYDKDVEKWSRWGGKRIGSGRKKTTREKRQRSFYISDLERVIIKKWIEKRRQKNV